MYSAHLSGSNHRAEGGQPVENQREDFTDVPKDVRTDGDKMGMSRPKGRVTVAVVCQDSLQLPGTE